MSAMKMMMMVASAADNVNADGNEATPQPQQDEHSNTISHNYDLYGYSRVRVVN